MTLQFNTSHVINKLSFGMDYPGLVNPLDEYQQYAITGKSTCMHAYNMLTASMHVCMHSEDYTVIITQFAF